MINQLFEWLKDHLLEILIPVAVLAGVVVVRIRSHINGRENTSQQAGGDIKNANVKGDGNKVVIK